MMAENSQHGMNGKYTHTHTVLTVGRINYTAAHQFICHVENIINHKLEVCNGMSLEGSGPTGRHWSGT